MSDHPSRRDFFRIAGAAGAAAAVAGHTLPADAQQQRQSANRPAQAQPQPISPPSGAAAYLFFTEPEAAFVTAAADRLIPADDQWPGASQAGVVDFIDRQLAGSYGAGYRLYLQGPWREGTPQQGYQLPYTPAELYRAALGDLNQVVAEKFGNRRLADLSAQQQDDFLKDLELGRVTLRAVPGPVFFETLLANVIEGFFSDPAYGGNRNMAGWRMVGFPGAYADFALLVENHGMAYERDAIGMAATSSRQHL